MELPNPLGGELQSLTEFIGHRGAGFGHLSRAHPEIVQIHVVEQLGVVPHRHVTITADVP